jgi:copper homeostasis protein
MSATPAFPLLEVCVDSPEAALAAQAGGAQRVELCSALGEGGLTPSLGAIELARAGLAIELFVLIRPRAGDFLYSAAELAVARRDIELCAQAGARGVVLGVLRRDGTIDRERTAALIECARPLAVSFHRAFDLTREPERALEELIELGVERVLTSGAERTALEGAALLRRLVERAGERIIVMPGGGIRASNVRELVRRTGARELHFTARAEMASPMEFHNPRCAMGSKASQGEYELRPTDPELVRSIRAALRDES